VITDPRSAGEAIAASAPELARLWRAMRLQARPGVWPGLLDGIASDLVRRVGEGLAGGTDPCLAWIGVEGLVRLDARARERSREEIDAECDALESVLAGACEALAGGEDVRDWIARALAAVRDGVRALGEGGAPPGVVVAWWLSGLPAPRRRAPDAGRP
jgi:hypothetical protein